MKKLLYLVSLVLFFVGCSKDDDSSVSFTSESFEVSHNATVKLSLSGDGIFVYTSSDETIATVDQQGNVTGHLIGEAIITATSGSQSATCKVVVKPAYSVFIEPYVKYACKAADIKAKETRTLSSEDTNELLYAGENSNVKSVSYLLYSTTGMIGAVVTLKPSAGLANVKAFLAERYPSVSDDGDVAVFDNDDVVVSVAASSTLIVVTYEPYPIVR